MSDDAAEVERLVGQSVAALEHSTGSSATQKNPHANKSGRLQLFLYHQSTAVTINDADSGSHHKILPASMCHCG